MVDRRSRTRKNLRQKAKCVRELYDNLKGPMRQCDLCKKIEPYIYFNDVVTPHAQRSYVKESLTCIDNNNYSVLIFPLIALTHRVCVKGPVVLFL